MEPGSGPGTRMWEADRAAVFDRDTRTCRHCERTPSTSGTSGLRVAAVGDVPLQGTVHESALVTLCDACFEILHGTERTTIDTREALFETIRSATNRQSEAISTVAVFASLATTVPAAIEEDDDPDYVAHRQDAHLVLAVVDATLEQLEALVGSDALEALDPGTEPDSDLDSALTAFCESATTLQNELREVIDLAEVVAVGLGRCQGCFEPLEVDPDPETGAQSAATRPCSTCGLEPRDIGAWRRDDGTVRFNDLFGAINAALQGSSATTTTLTARTQVVAERLLE
ncbi:HNH endonuclease [Natronosalvus vescus]|uniref:HNH endonuclease n=1 Tax=Natronosalvus vescus TaxID=2953881 RepID=UPI0020906DB3|nr:HNH endonuclease [Natronosalvus vescus]